MDNEEEVVVVESGEVNSSEDDCVDDREEGF